MKPSYIRIQFMLLTFVVMLTTACANQQGKQPPKPPIDSGEAVLTPTEVLAGAPDNAWRDVDHEHTLYIELDTGRVVIELLPELAPKHVSNTLSLVRQKVFDGSQFYRVLDGFVAQGGPLSVPTDVSLQIGVWQVPAEFTFSGHLGAAYVAFDRSDNYADETGFLKGFAVGRDLDSGESWLLHCYGALAMGRNNEPDSGGLALYIVNGPAQRYLDRNTTVFGRVVMGMEHIQALQRSADINGPKDLDGRNIMRAVKVASDVPAAAQSQLQIMATDSEAFGRLLAARKNRSGEWFVHQHDYIDACGVPIPVRPVQDK